MTLRNKKRSGGPRTPEGKKASSQNAIVIGTYSALPVLPGESTDEFNNLVDQFNHDFRPADVIETSLVRDLAVITWKKLRLEKLEQSVFIKHYNMPITLDDFVDCGLLFNESRYKFWEEHGTISKNQVESFRDSLRVLRRHVTQNVTLEQLLEIKQKFPFVYISLENAFQPYAANLNADTLPQAMVDKILLDYGLDYFFIPNSFKSLISLYEDALWCTDQHSQIEEAIQKIKQERLLHMMQSEGARRANEDLARGFSRTLNEFRKHHEWRMLNRVLDAEEE